jgi:hypothetical protein
LAASSWAASSTFSSLPAAVATTSAWDDMALPNPHAAMASGAAASAQRDNFITFSGPGLMGNTAPGQWLGAL